MNANRTHTPPPMIEYLGDGTFYYNFSVIHTKMEDDIDNYDYLQVRCDLPVDSQLIQQAIDASGSNHIVNI